MRSSDADASVNKAEGLSCRFCMTLHHLHRLCCNLNLPQRSDVTPQTLTLAVRANRSWDWRWEKGRSWWKSRLQGWGVLSAAAVVNPPEGFDIVDGWNEEMKCVEAKAAAEDQASPSNQVRKAIKGQEFGHERKRREAFWTPLSDSNCRIMYSNEKKNDFLCMKTWSHFDSSNNTKAPGLRKIAAPFSRVCVCVGVCARVCVTYALDLLFLFHFWKRVGWEWHCHYEHLPRIL